MAPRKQDGRWWLTQGSEVVVVRATPTAVYSLVADLSRMGEWSPECESVEWADGAEGPAEGARFVGHNRGGPGRRITWSRRGRVLTAQPGSEFSCHRGGRSGVDEMDLQVRSGGRRNPVTETYDVQWLPAWARIVDGPLNRRGELHRHMRHTLGQLKQAAESATTGAVPS